MILNGLLLFGGTGGGANVLAFFEGEAELMATFMAELEAPIVAELAPDVEAEVEDEIETEVC